MDDITQKIKKIKKNQDNWRKKECINLIASENVTSPLADEVYLNDAAHRYAEGKTWARHYQGSQYIDEIDSLTQDLFNTLFECKRTDLRPLSGTQSNMAAFAATTSYGDQIMTSAIQNGGHVSHTRFGTAGLIGLKEISFPFDTDEMNIDIDATKKLIREKKPKVVLFGGSVMLFPHPVKELSDTAKEHGATVMYDSAHVLGLIAGKQFQDP
ncbi:MAG: serine hydroxymethyltransferase, partial [Candidatus Diapherotrites archaeon]|nr:serine hydroxymethyltransferase [Candidatus Diapherotrites archaeon]